MRIFVALDLDDALRQRIQRFGEGVRGFAPDARWVSAESLHITLKFIGEKPAETIADIKSALGGVEVAPFDLSLRGYGFFPTAPSARVFWVGIECGPQLQELAKAVDHATSALGIPKEDRLFSPHLTLARGRGGSGAPGWRKGDGANRSFEYLREKLSKFPAPEFGTMTAREFFLYQSQLMRGGARYTKLERFALRSPDVL
ncbi:MAG TPA: RNA 2',3'-cyclic phosphodiesterase [Terriglobales bacterium]|nr:RNA 2',3'-cyclic phosphodiesterase [Terriglobales bacterium]